MDVLRTYLKNSDRRIKPHMQIVTNRCWGIAVDGHNRSSVESAAEPDHPAFSKVALVDVGSPNVVTYVDQAIIYRGNDVEGVGVGAGDIEGVIVGVGDVEGMIKGVIGL